MKVTYRIPTEQYAYVEIEREYPTEPTAEEVHDTYKRLTSVFKVQEGLSQKDFNTALDRYLNDGTGETEVYMAMSPAQKDVIQHIKRAFKRIEAKGAKLVVKEL